MTSKHMTTDEESDDGSLYNRYLAQSSSESDDSSSRPRRRPSQKKYEPRGKCLNKNAVMARQNRMRKKAYLENLEEEVESLREENRNLKSAYKKDKKVMKKMNEEVKYLRSVISKRTDIWKLLSTLNTTLKKKEAVKVEAIPQLVEAMPNIQQDRLQQMLNDPILPPPNEDPSFDFINGIEQQSLRVSFGRLAVHLPYGIQEPER